MNIKYQLAITLATLVGIFFNFSSYRLYLYDDKFSIYSLIKFFFSYILIYLLNLLCLNFLTIKMNPYLSQLICFPVVVLLNWVSLNLWVFKNIKK